MVRWERHQILLFSDWLFAYSGGQKKWCWILNFLEFTSFFFLYKLAFVRNIVQQLSSTKNIIILLSVNLDHLFLFSVSFHEVILEWKCLISSTFQFFVSLQTPDFTNCCTLRYGNQVSALSLATIWCCW